MGFIFLQEVSTAAVTPSVEQAAELVRQFGLAQGLLICCVVVLLAAVAWNLWDSARTNRANGALLTEGVTILRLVAKKLLLESKD